MDMNEKPGQPSMEEILASIRRIIAEEPAEPLPVAILQTSSAQKDNHAPAHAGLIDEGSEFELPSMFRPSAGTGQPEKPAALFGRLTDAIRNNATEAKAAPQPPASINEIEAGFVPIASAQPSPSQSFAQSLSQLDALAAAASAALPSLSSLKTVRQDYQERSAETSQQQAFPMPVAAPVGTAMPMAAKPEEPVKREMAAFKDTRFMRMTAPSNVVIETPAPSHAVPDAFPAPAPAPSVAAFPSHPTQEVPHGGIPVVAPVATPVPAAVQPQAGPVDSVLAMLLDLKRDIDALKRETAGLPHVEPVHHTYVAAPLYHAPEPAMHWSPSAQHTPPPIAPVDGSAGNGSIEDTTAELLRPMLRAWLSENMPRMVEKALHIEVADSVKLPRKPGQI